MTTFSSTASPELRQVNAELARLRRKLVRYREEIAELREKLEEPAYNEPESELERMAELEQAPIEAEPPALPPSPGYFRKIAHRFKHENSLVPVPWPPHPLLLLWSFIGSFVGIALLGLLHQYSLVPKERAGLIPSMGASVVLLFSATASPLAQPWNTITTAAFVGVAIRQVFVHISWLHKLVWLEGAFAVSIAIVIMNMFHALHPPAGATALIAVMGPELIWHQGWLYIALPVLVDATFLVLVAFFWDNLNPNMTFPTFWIPFGRKQKVVHTR